MTTLASTGTTPTYATLKVDLGKIAEQLNRGALSGQITPGTITLINTIINDSGATLSAS